MSVKSYKTKVDLKITQGTVLTPNLTAQLVTHIFELILFQRNQIPLMFATFKYMISKWTWENKNNSSFDETNNQSFELQRQRSIALQTLNDITKFGNVIESIFKIKKVIKSIRILIGPTALMPKEVYIINIPKTFDNHYDENHTQQMVEPIMRNFLKTILLSNNLSEIFLNSIKPSNVYMDFELESLSGLANEHLVLKEICDYAPNCRQIVIDINPCELEHTSNLSCCRNLKIFEDFNEDSCRDEKTKIKPKTSFYWYEVDSVVKGFKESKKVNIWKSQ